MLARAPAPSGSSSARLAAASCASRLASASAGSGGGDGAASSAAAAACLLFRRAPSCLVRFDRFGFASGDALPADDAASPGGEHTTSSP